MRAESDQSSYIYQIKFSISFNNTAPSAEKENIFDILTISLFIICEGQEGHKIDQAILVASTWVRMVSIVL